MPKFQYVIFDFDGTIADTSRGVYDSIIYALQSYGYEVPNEDVLASFLGPPLHASFMRATGCDDKTAEKLTAKYRELYTDNAMYRVRLFDGIKDMLVSLKENGIKMAIASSKPQHFFDKLLKHLEITEFFDAVCGASFDDKENTKEAIIDRALTLLKADKNKTLMVGDRCFDVDGAKQNGLKSLGVVFGYDYTEELKNAGADFIVYKASDITKEVF